MVALVGMYPVPPPPENLATLRSNGMFTQRLIAPEPGVSDDVIVARPTVLEGLSLIRRPLSPEAGSTTLIPLASNPLNPPYQVGVASPLPRASSSPISFTRGVTLALLLAVLWIPLEAQAQTPQTVPVGSAIIPAGLGVDDSFRLLFVTSTTRKANTNGIGIYNTFVQGRAAAGHAGIQAFSDEFRVLGSSVTVNARDNTATTGEGVPIYWLLGDQVADDYADFYDGNGWDSLIGRTESGGLVSAVPATTGDEHGWWVFTGSTVLAMTPTAQAVANAIPPTIETLVAAADRAITLTATEPLQGTARAADFTLLVTASNGDAAANSISLSYTTGGNIKGGAYRVNGTRNINGTM